DRVTHCLDLSRLLLAHANSVSVLELHHQLVQIQGIGVEVLAEPGLRLDSVRGHLELRAQVVADKLHHLVSLHRGHYLRPSGRPPRGPPEAPGGWRPRLRAAGPSAPRRARSRRGGPGGPRSRPPRVSSCRARPPRPLAARAGWPRRPSWDPCSGAARRARAGAGGRRPPTSVPRGQRRGPRPPPPRRSPPATSA